MDLSPQPEISVVAAKGECDDERTRDEQWGGTCFWKEDMYVMA
jgi:hypothetical protein